MLNVESTGFQRESGRLKRIFLVHCLAEQVGCVRAFAADCTEEDDAVRELDRAGWTETSRGWLCPVHSTPYRP
jgi:hypothetical protein